jgi:PAS domain S-box-containing protein
MFRLLTQINLAEALGKLSLLVLILALPVLSPRVVFAAETPKKVLIFSGTDPGLPSVVLVNQILRSTLEEGLPSRVQFYSEALDNHRIPEDKYEKEIIKLLQRKYEGEKIDLIFTLGSSALTFLLKHKDELFSDTPKVFVNTNEVEGVGLDLGQNVTGVHGSIELRPALDLALALHPGTRRVAVVTGNSSRDKFWEALAQKEFQSYEDNVEFAYLTNVTSEELRKELAALPPHTIVFFLSFLLDSAGNAYSLPESVSLVAPSSSAPIYLVVQSGFVPGVVGGRMISYEALGKSGADLGLRVLAGERPRDIPPQTVPSAAIFDWRELRRWGIDESRLPSGSIVRYKEFSVWELYKWRIIGAISLIVVQTLGIVWLLFTQAKRRQAEKRSSRFALLAEAERQHLDEIVANVPGIVWESRLEGGDPLPKTTFVSPYLEKMLGYTSGEWLSKPGFWLSVVVEEDREQAETTIARVLETGKDGVVQARFRTKDGNVVWVESHLTAIRDRHGKAVGLRGVTMDISDRRQAEAALQANQAQLAGIIGSAMDAIVSINERQRVVLFNAAAEIMFGCSAAEAVGQPLHRFIPAPLRDTHQDQLSGMKETNGGGLCVGSFASITGRRVSGEDFPIDVSISELELNQNRFYTIILRDISERLRAEDALKRAIEQVSQLKNKLEEENIYLQEEIKLAQNFDEIVGRSDATKYVLFKIEQVAPTDSTVLVTGETGTGKELVARAIHSSSLRKDRPLVRVNCAALSPTLIESELFGHEKGAFTGATARKIGRFELANEGTIFLDEIGELPLELQSKLLRVIQEGEFERLGSSKTIQVDARIVAATNRNLKIAVEKGSFREDLYYRLNVFPITVPPLRDRREDIPVLIEHFVKRFSQKVGRRISAIPPASLRILQNYSWPGNVRELANAIERAVINTDGTVLRIVDHFEKSNLEDGTRSDKTLEEIEKEYITRILHNTGWRIDGPKGAARILGLNPSTLRTRMAKLGIQKVNGKTLASVR